MKNLNEKRPSGLALLPFAMFIVIYMGAGIYYQVKGVEMAFYQFPSVTAMFLAVLFSYEPSASFRFLLYHISAALCVLVTVSAVRGLSLIHI